MPPKTPKTKKLSELIGDKTKDPSDTEEQSGDRPEEETDQLFEEVTTPTTSRAKDANDAKKKAEKEKKAQEAKDKKMRADYIELK